MLVGPVSTRGHGTNRRAPERLPDGNDKECPQHEIRPHFRPGRGDPPRIGRGRAGRRAKAGLGAEQRSEVLRAVDGADEVLQVPQEAGPYRIALANGFIGNTWRIQMIKTAKAYAEQPDIKKMLKEFKVVSTGEDIAAQISAINNFINSGYDAVVVDAQNPTAFKSVVRARQPGRRRAGGLRQHHRHGRSHQRQRRPGRPRPLLGRLARQEGAEWRQDPRSPRRGRHLGRQRPPQGHPGRAEGVGKTVRNGRGRRQVGRRHGPEGFGRCDRGA